MRLKISLATICGMFLTLLVLHGIRLFEGATNLRERTITEGMSQALLLGDIAEGLYNVEAYDEIQIRLETTAERLNIAVAFDSEFEPGIALAGDWGSFERTIVPQDTVYYHGEEVILQHYLPESGTALWVKLRRDFRSIWLTELKFMGYGALATLIVAIILSLFLNLIAVKPIMQVIRRLREIAKGEGDLTQRLNMDSRDEIGLLAKTFDEFMTHLQALVQEVVSVSETITQNMVDLSQTSSQLSEESQEVTQVVQSISAGAEQQSRRVEHMLQDSGHLSGFSDQVNRSAQEAQRVSVTVTQSASSGSTAIQTLAQKIADMSQVSHQAVHTVKALSEKSRRIQSIVRVIDDISRQVNLLALNAAIEAAHAGEQGRGFAVVAEEIRRLASQTEHATQDIARYIEEIEKISAETVQQTDVVTAKVSEGKKAIEETTVIFQTIASETDQSAQVIHHISELAAQQKEMVQTFVKTLENVAQSAETNLNLSQHVSTATQHQTTSMTDIRIRVQNTVACAQKLAALIDKFKV
ncbi:MAG: methyl-accepting chemotaxis protein [Gemmatimonadetes bacterium]|nr:MAG: methyl-accepting chemotaxis protein [Gemmatimonadota bacterium]